MFVCYQTSRFAVVLRDTPASLAPVNDGPHSRRRPAGDVGTDLGETEPQVLKGN